MEVERLSVGVNNHTFPDSSPASPDIEVLLLKEICSFPMTPMKLSCSFPMIPIKLSCSFPMTPIKLSVSKMNDNTSLGRN